MSEYNRGVPQSDMDSLYTKDDILKHKELYGQNWYSPAGDDSVKEFLLKLRLKPGNRVLDIGCGPGGAAFYMAKFCGVHVHGVDLSSHMIKAARDRLAKEDSKVRDKICFELADILKVDYDSNSFDVIYSQWSIALIPDKESLYKKLHSWLKPGGTLFIADTCKGEQKHSSEALREFLNRKKYTIMPIEDYSKMIKEAGFRNIEVTDFTSKYIEWVEKDLKHFEAMKSDFLKNFGEEDYNTIVNNWRKRLDWCLAGEQSWGIFQARK